MNDKPYINRRAFLIVLTLFMVGAHAFAIAGINAKAQASGKTRAV